MPSSPEMHSRFGINSMVKICKITDIVSVHSNLKNEWNVKRKIQCIPHRDLSIYCPFSLESTMKFALINADFVSKLLTKLEEPLVGTPIIKRTSRK